MSYAQYTDIQAEFPNLTFTSTTKVKQADVIRFCTEADAEIDSILGARYLVPITGTQALVLMRMIEIWLVKDRIQGIIEVKSPDQKTDQGGQTGLRDRAIKMLNQLASDTMRLTDATLASSSGGAQSYSNDNATPHVFESGVDQW